MRVLVTGGTGQLGSAISAALRDRGDQVRCLVRKPSRLGQLDPEGIELAVGDVTAPDTLHPAMKGVDAVVHAAGVVSYWARKRDWIHQVNVGGTHSVLDAAAAAGVPRVLLTSSIAALGWVPEGELGDEDTRFNWTGLDYFQTKRKAQDLVLGETRLEGLAVNPGIVFGAGDAHRNAGRMLLQMAQGKVPGVPKGATTVVSLDAVVRGHLLALDQGAAGRSYVLGSLTPSFMELYALIGELMDLPAPTRTVHPALVKLVGGLNLLKAAITGTEPPVVPALADITSRNRRYSSARAQSELGWDPGRVEDGILACRDWYRQQGVL